MTALSAMLDELMGRDRNAAPNEKRSEVRWEDDDVCRHFLCGFCPAELFTNTRSDLGACDKSHDERAKKAYQESNRYMRMGYEEDFLRYLQSCWQDVERRIRRNHQRLQLSEEKNQKSQQQSGNAECDEKVAVLNTRITEMLENIERLGGEGEVEQAQALMKLCDQLKEEREQLQNQKGGIMDTFSVQEKQMEVCEVCGAFLIVGDAQSRVDDHLMGKQHMGYAKIKSAIVELKEKLQQGPPQKATNGDRDRERRSSRDRRSSRERSSRRSAERRKYSRRSRSRERSRRSRSRGDRVRRSRSRDRSRRSPDRRRDSRRSSRDRDRRSSRDRTRRRSRDRKDSRERRRRSRDRSRERDSKKSRRSRSRERKSEKKDRSKDKKDDRHRRDDERKKDEKESKKEEEKKEEKKEEKNGLKQDGDPGAKMEVEQEVAKAEQKEDRKEEENKAEESNDVTMTTDDVTIHKNDDVTDTPPEGANI